MKKQTRSMLVLLGAACLCVGAYFGIRAGQAAKAEKEAAANAATAIGNLQDVQTLSLTNNGETWEFYLDGDGQWKYSEDDTFAVSSEDVENITHVLVGLTAVYDVDMSEDASAYGLDGGRTVTATDSQGNELSLVLGKKCADGSSYYAMLADGSACYTVAETLNRYTDKDLMDFASIPDVPDMTTDNMKKLTFTGRLGTMVLEREGEGEDAVWYVTTEDTRRTALEDFELPLLVTAYSSPDLYLDAILNDDMTYMALNYAYAFRPDSETLTACGLDSPKYTLTIDYTDEDGADAALTMEIGDYIALTEDDGTEIASTLLQRYCTVNGDGCIYSIDEDDYEKIEQTYFEFSGHDISEEPVGTAAAEE